jgi:hypothetical protein
LRAVSWLGSHLDSEVLDAFLEAVDEVMAVRARHPDD